MVPTTTMLYAALFGLMSIAIAFRPGSLRGKHNISIGDGGNSELLLGMRRHANFVEYVPLALILMALLEMSGGVQEQSMHVLGGSLLLFRICHAVGLKPDTVEGAARFVGAAGTALWTVVVSIWLILEWWKTA